MSILVSELDRTTPSALPVEVVERKGIGHPDTICDVLAEEVSLALSRYNVQRFGSILHHNVDKVLLRGGTAKPAFGGGEVTEPIEIYLAGRATREYRGVTIPVAEIAADACKAWLAGNLHALDVDRHVRIHCLLRPGSSDLVELFERQRPTGAPILANDTSIGVGFAPFTPLEAAVLDADRSMLVPRVPERGEDTKILGVRVGEQISLTIACAFVGRHIQDLSGYVAARAMLAERVRAAVGSMVENGVSIDVNAADNPESGSVYLTVTGTSAEAGDDGQTGRGNRVSGLITPARPMTIEALAGKNPITHTGKLYNIVATQIADALVSRIEDVQEAHVMLVSKIGTPIETPHVAHVRLRTARAGQSAMLQPHVRAIAREHLDNIGSLWEKLLTRNIIADGMADL